MRARPALAAAVALALSAACAGDDATDTASTTTPTTAVAASSSTTTASTAPDTTTSAGSSVAPPTTAVPAVPDVPDLEAVRLRLTEVAELDQPVALVLAPDGRTMYVAERVGRVRMLRDDRIDDEPVLDITSRTRASGERGLLGIALSPDGRRLYVHYTDRQGTSNVDEYTLGSDGRADPDSRRPLLQQTQPYANHNGGHLVTGPDGLLYIGLGDGGSANDPLRAGQDLGTWLGKILRIDPRPDGDSPYTVPDDNPFVATAGARPEIWSYGLRNPWRFSFDAATGDLWVADVGQDEREEVNVAAAADGAGRGANFGWSAFEASARFNDDQQAPGHVPPVHEYRHGDLGCSITGGFVYRGEALTALRGAYVFGDYCRSGVRAIPATGERIDEAVILADDPGSLVAFGEGVGRELYVLSLDGGVYRLDPG